MWPLGWSPPPTSELAIAPAAENLQTTKSALVRRPKPSDIRKLDTPEVDRALSIRIANMRHAKEIIIDRNYPCEEHTVIIENEACLKLYRIPNGRYGTTRYAEPKPTSIPSVILWHGLGLSAACWVCNPGPVHSNFAFLLADSEFDVWIVNGRGSLVEDHVKYAREQNKSPWDFSIDDIGYLDVPHVVDYVLESTGRSSLAFVGFSQGTAAAFSALSLHEELNKKINVFVGLAPCIQPSAPDNRLVAAMIHSFGPSVLFDILGTGQFLGIAQWGLQYLPPHFRSATIRRAFQILFDWDIAKLGCHNQHAALLSHSFNGLPVKNAVQWFQIIQEQNALQHYREATKLAFTQHNKHTPTKYPIKHITTQIHLFAGGADTLCDIHQGKPHLPPHARVSVIPEYNHLDLLWALDARDKVFEAALRVLRYPHAVPLKKSVSFAPVASTVAEGARVQGAPSLSEWLAGLANRGGVPGESLAGYTPPPKCCGREEEDSDVWSEAASEDAAAMLQHDTVVAVDADGAVQLEFTAALLRSLLAQASSLPARGGGRGGSSAPILGDTGKMEIPELGGEAQGKGNMNLSLQTSASQEDQDEMITEPLQASNEANLDTELGYIRDDPEIQNLGLEESDISMEDAESFAGWNALLNKDGTRND
ncbi:Alpha/Beta hydrolase protein [Chytriomyces sp. MP71]|nr:Alpha/Beta hydrolase protein [Chytriomyces sp. MP71]